MNGRQRAKSPPDPWRVNNPAAPQAAVEPQSTPPSLNLPAQYHAAGAALIRFRAVAWDRYFFIALFLPTIMHVIATIFHELLFCDPIVEVEEGYTRIRGPIKLRQRAPRVFMRYDQLRGFFGAAVTLKTTNQNCELEAEGSTQGNPDLEPYTDNIMMQDLPSTRSIPEDQHERYSHVSVFFPSDQN